MARPDPLDPRDRARRHSAREAQRSRDAHAAVADVGEIPAVANPERRKACGQDLHLFLRTYFPSTTGLNPFGTKQVDAIGRIQRCIFDGGRFLNAMPRGFVKSTIGENSTIFATLYGYRSYVVFFGSTEGDAEESIESIKHELVDNDLLFEDFPEVCAPARALEGKPQRCASQSYCGELTHIGWKGGTVVLPTIPVPRGWGEPGATLDWKTLGPSPASGAIIRTRGLLGSVRGMRFKRSDGRQARPDLGIIDDGQTDESAASPTQTAKRINVIRKSIARLGGHGRAIALVWNGTVIEEGDAVDEFADPKRHPEWQSIRIPMMPRMPDALETHWLKKYADLRRNYDPDDLEGQARAHAEATAYYKRHRKKMDAGAIVSWEHIPLETGEISAVQHAMNILIDDGEDVFASECQNEPKRPHASGVRVVSDAADLARKKSGVPRLVVPDWAAHLVFHVDVHANVHFASVAAVDAAFRGTVVDYRTYPEQSTRRFTQARAKRTFKDLYPKEKLSQEELIVRSLIEFFDRLCGCEWTTQSGAKVSVGLGLVDTGNWDDLVATAILRSPHHAVLMGSRGVGFGPRSKPMTEYDTSENKMRRCGPDRKRPRWYVPKTLVHGVQVVRFDQPFWMGTAHARLNVAAGGAAEWTLFGGARDDHTLYAEHLASKEPIPTTADGRTVDIWHLRSGCEDHWLDTFVGCTVAASVLGCRIEAATAPKPAPKASILPPLGITYAGED